MKIDGLMQKLKKIEEELQGYTSLLTELMSDSANKVFIKIKIEKTIPKASIDTDGYGILHDYMLNTLWARKSEEDEKKMLATEYFELEEDLGIYFLRIKIDKLVADRAEIIKQIKELP